MAEFKPAAPFSVTLMLLKPTYSKAGGARKKTYPEIASGEKIQASFKTYGGTERTVDGLYSIEDTAIVETWYRPDITSDCAVAFPDTGEIYEIKNTPENINRRNQFLKFKVQRIKGGA